MAPFWIVHPFSYNHQDLSQVFLPLLSSAILRGLQDVDDDVRAVAASALLPVAQQLHLIIPYQVRTQPKSYIIVF